MCPEHPGAPIRRRLGRDSQRPTVELLCSPQNGDRPHLLSSTEPQRRTRARPVVSDVTAADCDLLVDAATGLTIVESASKRGASVDSVKAQRRTLMVKLDARNMTHAIAVAMSQGLISRPPRGAGRSDPAADPARARARHRSPAGPQAVTRGWSRARQGRPFRRASGSQRHRAGRSRVRRPSRAHRRRCRDHAARSARGRPRTPGTCSSGR